MKVSAIVIKEDGARAAGCGLNGVSSFTLEPNNAVRGPWDWRVDLATACLKPGCGFTIASFTNTAACKAAYEVLSKRFEIAYQSPVRRNSHHRERAHTGTFYVIFDTKKEKKA